MTLALQFREAIKTVSYRLLLDLEQVLTHLRTFLYTEHNADGTHAAVTAASVTADLVVLPEVSAPGNGAANTARLYCRDNGSGKSQVVVVFQSGAVQVLATEP